jgi:hypothetical protein
MLVLALAAVIATAAMPNGTPIRARFVADRVHLDLPVTDNGPPLDVVTDSGGGSLILTRTAAARLGLTLTPETNPEAQKELGADAATAPIGDFAPAHWPPLPPTARFLVLGSVSPLRDWPGFGDGIFGYQLFAGHTWTWDYAHGRLTLRPAGWTPPATARPWPISFRTGADGRRTSEFGRISIAVDDETLPMLFDTGATTVLTAKALATLGDGGPAARATSMITRTQFEQWAARHPDWPVIVDAQLGTHARMIRVPAVEVAGHLTGPVWFTERPDAAFHQFMSSMMSGQVEGALGGNALHGLAVTVDYPQARAWVE